MISPELLRQYTFFGAFNDQQLKEIAMLTTEEILGGDIEVFKGGAVADAFYFLLSGGIDLYHTIRGIKVPQFSKGIPVGEINPGEPFGISSFIEPYHLTSSAWTSKPSRILKIDAKGLKELTQRDEKLSYFFMVEVAKAAMQRLNTTRIQLAAAWA